MDFIDEIEKVMETYKDDKEQMGIEVQLIVADEMGSGRKVYQSQVNIIEEELNKVGASMYEETYEKDYKWNWQK